MYLNLTKLRIPIALGVSTLLATISIVWLTGAGAALFERISPTPHPNIIFILSDQHRNASWSLGSDPNTVYTPALERLAAEGIVFSNCISNFPLCSPYRAALLTGMLPQHTTVQSNVGRDNSGLPTVFTTFAEQLKSAGYATGYVGKWHLFRDSYAPLFIPPGPNRHGFDDLFDISFFWNDERRDRLRTVNERGEIVSELGYEPALQMDHLLKFIDANKRSPFLAFLSFNPPHDPYTGSPPEFAELYDPKTMVERENVPERWRTDAEHKKELTGYYASISALDAQIGRLLDSLEQLGIKDNTIIVYTSDHGDMQRSHGAQAKNVFYEESINVPFILSWPNGIPRRPGPVSSLLSTIDIAPTILGLAGIDIPPLMDGRDVSRMLRDKRASWAGRESAFIMYTSPDIPGRRDGWRGVRTGRYTYVKDSPTLKDGVAWYQLQPTYLFDNVLDPFQLQNLVSEPTHTEKAAELDTLLRAWMTRAGET